MPTQDRTGTICWFEMNFPPPWFERYQRWIVSAACFSAVFLALGIECSYVILFVYLQEEFDSTATATGWSSSLAWAITCGLSPIATWLFVRFGSRKVMLVGMLLMTIGILGTSFATAMWIIYISYGIVFAVGANFSYTLAIHVTNCYFPDKHYARAMSIVTNGTPAGLLVLSPTMERLYTYCGWRNGLRILSAFVLITGGAAALIVQEPSHNSLKSLGDEKETEKLKRTENLEKTEKLKTAEEEKYELELLGQEETTLQRYLTLMRMPEYWLLFIATVFSTIAGVFNVINLVSYMDNVGVHSYTASLLVSAMSVSEFVVRGLMAVFMGRLPFNNLIFLSITCFIGGVAGFACTAGHWLWLLIIYVLAAGLSRASFYTMCYVVTRDIFGIRLCAESNSLQLIAIGVGCLVTSTITGLAADMTGSYHLCFYIVGSLWVIAAVLYIVIYQLDKRKKTNLDDFMTNEEKERALKAARFGVLLPSDQVYEKFIADNTSVISL